MEKILELFALCKAEVMITYNGHRSSYETVTDYIRGWGGGDKRDEIPDDVFAEMVKRHTVIEVQFYPHTPIGFYLLFHYDLELAIEQALALVQSEIEA